MSCLRLRLVPEIDRFFIHILILKNNINTLMIDNGIDFSFLFSILAFRKWPYFLKGYVNAKSI